MWIAEYLRARCHYVVSNGAKCGVSKLTSVVPQGSVLDPLLFVIFINDNNENVLFRIRKFAVDCTLYNDIRSNDDCCQLQTDLRNDQSTVQKMRHAHALKRSNLIRFSREKKMH